MSGTASSSPVFGARSSASRRAAERLRSQVRTAPTDGYPGRPTACPPAGTTVWPSAAPGSDHPCLERSLNPPAGSSSAGLISLDSDRQGQRLEGFVHRSEDTGGGAAWWTAGRLQRDESQGCQQDQPLRLRSHRNDQEPIVAATGIVAAAALCLGVATPAMASTPKTHSGAVAVSSQDDPPGIYAPNTPIVINHSGQALTITGMDVTRGANHAYWTPTGLTPGVGVVIPAGGSIRVNWLEYFFGSDVELSYRATDGSTIMTSTGYNVSGWGYGCDDATGSLKCDDNGTNPSNWDVNVTIDRK